MGKFSPESLPELLSVYYKRLFPFEAYTRWLSYGNVNPDTFSNRELSFTLAGDIYIRYQSFDKPADFESELQKKCPEKIDIGAVYNIKPKSKKLGSDLEVVERELIFDIDITDYDSVRTCCKDADVCGKCWQLMSIATKILDTALRDDFGFKHILWVFSGRRGVHCWVCDEVARKLESNVRSAVAEYLQVLTREDSAGKMVNLSDKTHPSVRRALDIIETVFVDVCVEGQNILGTTQGMSQMLQMMEDNLRKEVEPAWERLNTSLDRWAAFVGIFERMRGELKWKNKHLVDEIMLQWAYPRLDIAVTKGANHLLKSPFCIHPKTGKLCIPFNPSTAITFDPDGVPTINELIDELMDFDRKEAREDVDVKRKVKNYKKTSMYKSMQIFEEFLRNLEASCKNAKTGWTKYMMAKTKQSREEKLRKKRVAERLRLEKIRSDPMLRAIQKEKDREKYQKKLEKKQIKKVCDMSEREKRSFRKIWREKAKKAYKKKKIREKTCSEGCSPNIGDSGSVFISSTPTGPGPSSQPSTLSIERKKSGRRKVKRDRSQLMYANEKLKRENQCLKRRNEKLRKRLYRKKIAGLAESPRSKVCKIMKKNDQKEIAKRLIFGETLAASLKTSYSDLSSRNLKLQFKKTLTSNLLFLRK